MASQGGKLSTKEYSGGELCNFCKKKLAEWSVTCSPNFFELIVTLACEECKRKCEKCTESNKPVKSALDY